MVIEILPKRGNDNDFNNDNKYTQNNILKPISTYMIIRWSIYYILIIKYIKKSNLPTLKAII